MIGKSNLSAAVRENDNIFPDTIRDSYVLDFLKLPSTHSESDLQKGLVKQMEKKLKQSILTSYLIGVPIGILTVIATIWIPLLLTGEGLFTIVFLGTYGTSTIGLGIAFLIALWIGGNLAYKSIKKGKSILLTSFKCSIVVNFIIWTTFCLIVGMTVTEERFLMMIPAIIAFVVCTILTTFSIGILISYIIRRINNKPTELKNTVSNNV